MESVVWNLPNYRPALFTLVMCTSSRLVVAKCKVYRMSCWLAFFVGCTCLTHTSIWYYFPSLYQPHGPPQTHLTPLAPIILALFPWSTQSMVATHGRHPWRGPAALGWPSASSSACDQNCMRFSKGYLQLVVVANGHLLGDLSRASRSTIRFRRTGPDTVGSPGKPVSARRWFVV